MMRPLILGSFTALSALLVLAATGCTSGGGDDDGDKAPAVCPEGNEIAGVCAGVPASALCGADACTAGVACSSVINASDDASLASAASSAAAGACIALAPGAYGDVTLPGGVSLLGKSARDVTLSHVTLGAGGTGAVLRGVAVKGGGVEVLGEGAQITSCLIDGSSGAGVTVGPNASLSMASSEVTSSTTYGVSAFDAASLAIDTSIIRGSSGPGLWAQCASGCDCPAAPVASIKHTIIRDNKIVGVSMVGVAASLEAVDVRDNAEAPNFQGSGGVSIAGCSTVTASGLRVLDNSSFGVLVDGSSATLGGPSAEQAIEVSRNFMGVWIQNVTEAQPVKLDGLKVAENQAVGIGTSGEARGIICWNSAITGTKLAVIPVLAGGAAASKEVGDGLTWLGGSGMQLDHLTLSGNGRASILIDGDAAPGSSMSNITLAGGDEMKGVVQQSATGASPITVGSGAPALTTSASEKFAVPIAPSVPVGK